ncbi:hypothetical protein Ccrd_025445 [Cynara cardunculus var. scolymus]|uniref:Uncharacterized protein n=1 Tax=Cynara cardunculus var. scolymus TaxID=59895 RepID=A0A103X5P8_CYNCS|nr:hypothetical protein Ccrd_025445 [Cynara cardunculus var. scolymus]
MMVGCLRFGDHATPRAHFRDIDSRIYVLDRHPCDLNVHTPTLYFYFLLVSCLGGREDHDLVLGSIVKGAECTKAGSKQLHPLGHLVPHKALGVKFEFIEVISILLEALVPVTLKD